MEVAQGNLYELGVTVDQMGENVEGILSSLVLFGC